MYVTENINSETKWKVNELNAIYSLSTTSLCSLAKGNE